MIRQTIPAGSVIFDEGDAADCAYLIERGSVEIIAERGEARKVLAILGPGELFGEMGVIDCSTRSATARAIHDCQLLVVSSSQIRQRIDKCEPFLAILLRKIVGRFRTAQRTLLNDTAAPPPSVPEQDADFDWLKREREIHEALLRGEIVPFFQPIVDIGRGGRIKGFEALARWISPERGIVPPGEFLPLAEQTGLISKIDLAIAEHSCRFLAATAHLPHPPCVSVNLSAWHFRDATVVKALGSLIAAHGIDPGRIKLELTESMMIEDPLTTHAVVEALKELGVCIALDDFGTGYSSLSTLARMPIDMVKIDRSFVIGMHEDPRALGIVRAMLGLARDLGMQVVAEGIEDETAADTLRRMGCRLGQGFHYSRPVPCEEALALLE